MRVERFEWEGVTRTAASIRRETAPIAPSQDVSAIRRQVAEEGDEAIFRLTKLYDATEEMPTSLRVDRDEAERALAEIDPGVREALEVSAANVRSVAEAQVDTTPRKVELPQGQNVIVRELAVGAAGIYAPCALAAYPSSVVMCAVPARVAGVERIALASPPERDGRMNRLVLAAAALSDVDELYAMGGAQAVFALADGTESVAPVDVVVGPGSVWVQEAKRAVNGQVGIDSYAGPSELMLVAGADTDVEWAALDICAQAEHGRAGMLLAVAVEQRVLEEIGEATKRLAGKRGIHPAALLALTQVPSFTDAIELANAIAPEHLELLDEEAATMAEAVRSAGCVFVGPLGATAFGDYAAGSNHVLPTGGTGRFSGPLGPAVFRRKISTVEVSAEAAAKLAPHVDVLARAEGFPVHGESAMIRTEP